MNQTITTMMEQLVPPFILFMIQFHWVCFIFKFQHTSNKITKNIIASTFIPTAGPTPSPTPAPTLSPISIPNLGSLLFIVVLRKIGEWGNNKNKNKVTKNKKLNKKEWRVIFKQELGINDHTTQLVGDFFVSGTPSFDDINDDENEASQILNNPGNNMGYTYLRAIFFPL